MMDKRTPKARRGNARTNVRESGSRGQNDGTQLDDSELDTVSGGYESDCFRSFLAPSRRVRSTTSSTDD